MTIGFGLLVALDTPPLDFRGSPWLLPVAQALVALPLVVRALVPTLRGVDERQREAAATLGASPLRIVRDIDLPTAWRSLLAAAGFAFAVSLGEFGATSFLSRPDDPTLSVLDLPAHRAARRRQLRYGDRRVGPARRHDGRRAAGRRAAPRRPSGSVLTCPTDPASAGPACACRTSASPSGAPRC